MIDKSKNAYEQLMKGVQSYVDMCLGNSNADKTVTAIIKSVYEDDEGYSVMIDNRIYDNVKSIGGNCRVNETVNVLIPQGNYNNMIILKANNNNIDLPIASRSTLGVIRVGNGLTIDSNGILSVAT